MSNYVKTTNFLRKDSLPDTDADKIIRGSEFDAEFNNLVIAVASKANTVSPELTGVPRAPTATAGTSTTQIATTAFVAQNAILSGMILMWSGTTATIPTGYLLCNGTSGTPDLRNRFIVGAGSTYAPGAKGGSADAIVPSHNHSASSAVTDPGHLHSVTSGGETPQGLYGESSKENPGQFNTNKATTGISVATTVNHAGVSAANANLPPYYSLAFIMKS
jgi:hypothetical protein